MSWLSSAVAAVGSAVNDVTGAVAGAATDAGNFIVDAANAAAEAAAAAAAAAAQAAADVAAAVAAAATTVVNSVAAAVDEAAEWAEYEAIYVGQQVAQMIDLGNGMLQFICNDGFTYVMSAADYAAEQAYYAAQDAYYAAESAATAVAETVTDAAEAVGAAVTDVAEAVGGAASAVGGAIEDAADGIDGLVTGAGDAVQGVVEGAATGVNSAFAGTFLEGATIVVTRSVTEATNFVIDGAVNSVDAFTDTFELPADLLQGDLEGVRDTLVENAGEYVGIDVHHEGNGVWEASFSNAVPGVSAVDTSVRGGITADGDAVVGADVGVSVNTGAGGRASAGVGADLSVGASGFTASADAEGEVGSVLGSTVGGSVGADASLDKTGVDLGLEVEEHASAPGVEQSSELEADVSVGDPYHDLFDAGVRTETEVDTALGGGRVENEVRFETVHKDGERGGLDSLTVTAGTEQEVDVLGNRVASEFDVKVAIEDRGFDDPVTGLGGVFEATSKTEVDTLFVDHSGETHIEADVAVGLGVGASVGASHSGETTVLGQTSSTEVSAEAEADLLTREHIIGAGASAAVETEGPIDSSLSGAAEAAFTGEGVTAEGHLAGSVDVAGVGGSAAHDVSVGATGERGLFVDAEAEAEVHTPVGGAQVDGAVGLEVDYSGGDIITGGTDGFGVKGTASGGAAVVDGDGEVAAGIGASASAEARSDDGVEVTASLFEPESVAPSSASASDPHVAVRQDALADAGPDPVSPVQITEAAAAAPGAPSVFAVTSRPAAAAPVGRRPERHDDDDDRGSDDRVLRSQGRPSPAPKRNADDGDGDGEAGAAGAALGSFATARADDGDAATLGAFSAEDPIADAAREAEEQGILDGALEQLEDLGDSVRDLVDDLNPFD